MVVLLLVVFLAGARRLRLAPAFFLLAAFAAAFLFRVRAAFLAEAIRWAFVLFAIESLGYTCFSIGEMKKNSLIITVNSYVKQIICKILILRFQQFGNSIDRGYEEVLTI